jgi:hypothetical protein
MDENRFKDFAEYALEASVTLWVDGEPHVYAPITRARLLALKEQLDGWSRECPF